MSASVLRTAHPPLEGSEPKPLLYTRLAWEQVRPRACVCAWRSAYARASSIQMSRNIVVMWDFLFVFVTIICTCPDTASMKNLSREKQLRRSRLRQGTAVHPKCHASH